LENSVGPDGFWFRLLEEKHEAASHQQDGITYTG